MFQIIFHIGWAKESNVVKIDIKMDVRYAVEEYFMGLAS